LYKVPGSKYSEDINSSFQYSHLIALMLASNQTFSVAFHSSLISQNLNSQMSLILVKCHSLKAACLFMLALHCILTRTGKVQIKYNTLVDPFTTSIQGLLFLLTPPSSPSALSVWMPFVLSNFPPI
jgi:hypothetical protein